MNKEEAKEMLRKAGPGSDKISNFTDKYGLANPVEVVNEALGGETREESKKRREAAKEKETSQPVKKAMGGTVGSASKRADGCAIRGKTRA
jgi:hypothetical protein